MIIDRGDLEGLREALEDERDSLNVELATHGERMQQDEWEPTSSGLQGEEADPSDVADQIEELVTNVPLVDELQRRLHDIDDALEKIKEGTYGTCEVDGEAIPLERLKANPAARTCIAHAS